LQARIFADVSCFARYVTERRRLFEKRYYIEKLFNDETCDMELRMIRSQSVETRGESAVSPENADEDPTRGHRIR